MTGPAIPLPVCGRFPPPGSCRRRGALTGTGRRRAQTGDGCRAFRHGRGGRRRARGDGRPERGRRRRRGRAWWSSSVGAWSWCSEVVVVWSASVVGRGGAVVVVARRGGRDWSSRSIVLLVGRARRGGRRRWCSSSSSSWSWCWSSSWRSSRARYWSRAGAGAELELELVVGTGGRSRSSCSSWCSSCNRSGTRRRASTPPAPAPTTPIAITNANIAPSTRVGREQTPLTDVEVEFIHEHCLRFAAPRPAGTCGVWRGVRVPSNPGASRPGRTDGQSVLTRRNGASVAILAACAGGVTSRDDRPLSVWTDPDTAMHAVGTSLGIFDDQVSAGRLGPTESPLRSALLDVLLALVDDGELEKRACADGRYAFRWREDVASSAVSTEAVSARLDAYLAAMPRAMPFGQSIARAGARSARLAPAAPIRRPGLAATRRDDRAAPAPDVVVPARVAGVRRARPERRADRRRRARRSSASSVSSAGCRSRASGRQA